MASQRERGALFVNPGWPITAKTMSVHIKCTNGSLWGEIALSTLQPDGGVLTLAAHRAAFEHR
jgi:exodeoxyribonuclease X